MAIVNISIYNLYWKCTINQIEPGQRETEQNLKKTVQNKKKGGK